MSDRTRRVNGEGTVSRRARADGLWVARYSYVDDAGVTRRPVLYAKTRAEVARKLREALAVRDRGERPPSRQTVADYLATWQEGRRSQVRRTSWARNGEHIRLHLVPLLGTIPLQKLTPADVQRAYSQLLSQGLSPWTVRGSHAVLRRALDQAVRWRLLPSNAAAMAEPPRIPHREMQTLSGEQARRLLEVARGDRLEALWVLAITTGLRQGELFALRWTEVDVDRGWLQVTGSLSRVAGEGLVIEEPKTTRSRRRVELSSAAVEALRRHRLAQLEERVAAANVWDDRGLVFAGPAGDYLRKRYVTTHFQRLLDAAELPRIRFHDLRHTAASLLLGRGIHPKIAADMLGHSTTAITMDLYSHVTATMQREAVAVFDDILG